jgi:TonB-dependent SusC/RagA subfamily outer membrane receptor
MIVQLMLYGLVTATFLALAATAAEAGLRTYGRSARWAWISALIVSIGLPVLSLVAPDLQPAGAAGSLVGDLVRGAGTLVLPPVVESIAATQSWSAKLDAPLLLAWCAMSGSLLVLLVWSARRLEAERRGWRRVRVGGATAWLSGDVGPAVVGIGSNAIVVPAWVLELEHDVQRLISLHEEEHLRAGDLPLMLAGLCLVLLAPWNPALWWQLRRLRLAVEADCDDRVLRRGVDVLSYSSLLLEVGGRAARHHLPALAFIKKSSTLARRIHLMTWKPRMRLGRAVGAAALAATFGVLACETTTVSGVETEAVDAQLVAEGTDTSMVYVHVQMVDGSGDEPLYVVDGVIVARGVIDIDALNIESIEVIKGETAKELYGERAANGVIIIATKQGQPEEAARLRPVVERKN